jgi:hypothetical protein
MEEVLVQVRDRAVLHDLRLEPLVDPDCLASGAEHGEQCDGDGTHQGNAVTPLRRTDAGLGETRSETQALMIQEALLDAKAANVELTSCAPVSSPSLAARNRGSFMPRAFVHTTAPT